MLLVQNICKNVHKQADASDLKCKAHAWAIRLIRSVPTSIDCFAEFTNLAENSTSRCSREAFFNMWIWMWNEFCPPAAASVQTDRPVREGLVSLIFSILWIHPGDANSERTVGLYRRIQLHLASALSAGAMEVANLASVWEVVDQSLGMSGCAVSAKMFEVAQHWNEACQRCHSDSDSVRLEGEIKNLGFRLLLSEGWQVKLSSAPPAIANAWIRAVPPQAPVPRWAHDLMVEVFRKSTYASAVTVAEVAKAYAPFLERGVRLPDDVLQRYLNFSFPLDDATLFGKIAALLASPYYKTHLCALIRLEMWEQVAHALHTEGDWFHPPEALQGKPDALSVVHAFAVPQTHGVPATPKDQEDADKGRAECLALAITNGAITTDELQFSLHFAAPALRLDVFKAFLALPQLPPDAWSSKDFAGFTALHRVLKFQGFRVYVDDVSSDFRVEGVQRASELFRHLFASSSADAVAAVLSSPELQKEIRTLGDFDFKKFNAAKRPQLVAHSELNRKVKQLCQQLMEGAAKYKDIPQAGAAPAAKESNTSSRDHLCSGPREEVWKYFFSDALQARCFGCGFVLDCYQHSETEAAFSAAAAASPSGKLPASVLWHRSHIISHADGGAFEITNMLIFCANCNSGEGGCGTTNAIQFLFDKFPTKFVAAIRRLEKAHVMLQTRGTLANFVYRNFRSPGSDFPASLYAVLSLHQTALEEELAAIAELRATCQQLTASVQALVSAAQPAGAAAASGIVRPRDAAPEEDSEPAVKKQKN